jgi:hypothetical protein
VAVSLNLGYDAAEPWPIWVESGGAARSYGLLPGDALLYKGIEITHWRESFQGEHCAQVFLNYVDQNGPYTEWKYYKRTGLGTSPVTKHMMEKLASAPVGGPVKRVKLDILLPRGSAAKLQHSATLPPLRCLLPAVYLRAAD